MVYLFSKWLHIIAVISWMAGILYLFRIFVYQAERGSQSADNHALLCVMAERLYRYITVPAMLVAWLAGLAMLAQQPSLLSFGWMHSKLLAVLLLSGATGYAGGLRRKFAHKTPGLPSGRTLRLVNEIPTLLMLVIVAMVVFRPF